MSDAIRSTTEPSSREEADAWLRERAQRTVWAHLNTRDDADFAPSVKSMIEQTQREYSGRFLFELIQNAYDRQSRDSVAGRVAIILVEDEHDHGTLYVANTGTGFSASDVRRIGSLGLSDKQVGEGIGNKGIGFKSVLQVCTTPEVYSTCHTVSLASASASPRRRTSRLSLAVIQSTKRRCSKSYRCTTSQSRQRAYRRAWPNSGRRASLRWCGSPFTSRP
jgi:hypothetical protein